MEPPGSRQFYPPKTHDEPGPSKACPLTTIRKAPWRRAIIEGGTAHVTCSVADRLTSSAISMSASVRLRNPISSGHRCRVDDGLGLHSFDNETNIVAIGQIHCHRGDAMVAALLFKNHPITAESMHLPASFCERRRDHASRGA